MTHLAKLISFDAPSSVPGPRQQGYQESWRSPLLLTFLDDVFKGRKGLSAIDQGGCKGDPFLDGFCFLSHKEGCAGIEEYGIALSYPLSCR